MTLDSNEWAALGIIALVFCIAVVFILPPVSGYEQTSILVIENNTQYLWNNTNYLNVTIPGNAPVFTYNNATGQIQTVSNPPPINISGVSINTTVHIEGMDILIQIMIAILIVSLVILTILIVMLMKGTVRKGGL